MPLGKGLVLNLLRWSEEVRTMEGLALPGEDVKVSPRKLQMAEMLVNDLAGAWSPDLFHDEFKEQLAELIDKKAKAGKSIVLAGSPQEETPRQDTRRHCGSHRDFEAQLAEPSRGDGQNVQGCQRRHGDAAARRGGQEGAGQGRDRHQGPVQTQGGVTTVKTNRRTSAWR